MDRGTHRRCCLNIALAKVWQDIVTSTEAKWQQWFGPEFNYLALSYYLVQNIFNQHWFQAGPAFEFLAIANASTLCVMQLTYH